MEPELIQLTDHDFSYVKEIYDHYILHSTATFHTEKISISELKDAILVNHPVYKSFIINVENQPCGFCYIGPYKKRQAYNRTAEVTIYLHPAHHGKGLGKNVLLKLERIATNVGFAVLVGVITGENQSSIALFEKCGYEKCAHFKDVGEKFNRILDVVAYQKIIHKK